MSTKRMSENQKQILEVLVAYPDSTQIEIARSVFSKEVSYGSSEFSSIGRSLRSLERRGLAERTGGRITWRKTQPK